MPDDPSSKATEGISWPPEFDVAIFEMAWDHGVGGPTYRVILDPLARHPETENE